MHAVRNADLVVNATSVGLSGDAMPVDPGLLPHHAACLDLVYRRSGNTPWVQRALDQGRRANDGIQMLIAQGARAWTPWFGMTPDQAIMRRALDRARAGTE